MPPSERTLSSTTLPAFLIPPFISFPNKTVSVTFTLHGLKMAGLCVVFKSTCVYHIHTIHVHMKNYFYCICNCTVESNPTSVVSVQCSD